MAETTEISWTDATFNPWIGCTKVHAGCTNCYAERDFDKRRGFAKWGPNGTRVITSEANWKKPLSWNRKAEKEGRRMRVFCASLADVFEDWEGECSDHQGNAHYTHDHDPGRVVTNAQMIGCDSDGYHYTTLDDVRRRLFALIDATPWLDWLLVTKRPENVRRMWADKRDAKPIFPGMPGPLGQPQPCIIKGAHRSNVWLLTSVSDHPTAEMFVPELLKWRDLVPVLGLSIEPLLGEIILRYEWLDKLDWIIVGGESGPNARPMHPDWVCSLRNQATAAGVPFHFKQWGEWITHSQAMQDEEFPVAETSWTHNLGDDDDWARVGKAAAGRLLDGRTWDEFPLTGEAVA